MLCPSCHTLNRDGARFCKSCGMSFPQEHKDAAMPVAAMPTPSGASAEATTTPSLSTAPAPEPEIAQSSTAQPLPQEQSQADSTIEDITQAPTLLLSPEEMMAYHTKRWQQEISREQGGTTQDTPTSVTASEIADQPTQAIEPLPASDLTTEDTEATTDAKSTPAEAVPPEDAPAQSVEAEPSEEEQAQQPTPSLTSATAATADDATTADDFPALATGTMLQGRYEVLQPVELGEHEHTYQVVDHQGYRHCWNCASEQNAEGDEFCIECGAELLDVVYTMHEYPTREQDNEAHVLHGHIVNTFMENGYTYLVEQPQAEQSAFPNGVHLLVATDSDAGTVRRSDPNEDSTLVLQMQRIHESMAVPVGVFITADGMGGHDNGQGASRMTINVIAEHIARSLLATPLTAEMAGEAVNPLNEEDCVTLIKGAIEDANVALCKANQRNKSDMGSTVTGFMIVDDHAYIINVGDSRTYMLREGKLYQLTNDHSLVGQLVAGGLIEPDDVYTHPQRSQIFRSLGDKMNVQVDDFKQQLRPGDILLSCSDGLWEMVRNPQITEILINAPDPQTACMQLIEAANTNGGEDNISAVVVFVRG